MTQKNVKSGTVRPIRRVLPGETISLTSPPVFVPPKNASKHKASWSTPVKSDAKKVKVGDVSTGDGVENGLELEPLFAGKYGHEWRDIISNALEAAQPQAAGFVGPGRSNEILPVREMTFRALIALPPEENSVIVFGQSPYPRIQSASGIAMFDSLIQTWDCPQFGKTTSMRCIAKAAAIAKGIVSQDATVADMRKVFKVKEIVTPPQWFQAMLSQGVLMLNASLTNGGTFSTAQHTRFWAPIMRQIIGAILERKVKKFPASSPKRRIAFLWWGAEALKTKKALGPLLLAYQDDLDITHIEHPNPAAQGDKFVQPPNHFVAVNAALENGGLEAIDWLPDKSWIEENHSDEHEGFILETQKLHEMYLERLQSGLDLSQLAPITGVMESPLLPLPDACDGLGLRKAAESAVDRAGPADEPKLSEQEKGAIFLYTTNVLYRRLNEALRNANRDKVSAFTAYLRIFIEAFEKMAPTPTTLYRGIRKDVSEQYKPGSVITWWTVSSCTPVLGVAKAFGGGGGSGSTLFHVRTKTAVPIMHLSAYKSESEFVLAPGTSLKVVSVTKAPGQAAQVVLEEMGSKRLVQ